MPGTPPLGPAALPRVRSRTRPARRAVLILVLAVAVAAATAHAPARAQAPAACPSATVPLGAAAPAAVEAAVLCLANGERAARGLVPVRRAGALEVAARRHAADMVARRYFAHVSPSGGTVDKRARRAGYLTAPCWAVGEDLGWAAPEAASAEAVVAAWMASPKHRSVILDAEFRDAGIGLAARLPTGDGAGATFVLELGAVVPCGPAGGAGGTVRAAPRARVGAR
jgi:uncharacterized protein YkwD